MKKDFDRWNEMKKQLEHEAMAPLAFPQNGEVWMCTLGKNLGREQNGGLEDFSRPVLVIRKFNNEMFWIVPLTTKQKPLVFYFNYNDPAGAPVAAILSQLRLVSVSRFRRFLYELPRTQLDEMRATLCELVENRKPAVKRVSSELSESESIVSTGYANSSEKSMSKNGAVDKPNI